MENLDALAPVADSKPEGPQDGIALCLSGGGFRAMVFHLGVLWRLNELGYLGKLARVSSVSGGSITAAMLGLRWGRLRFEGGVARALGAEVIEPIRAFARRTVDAPAIIFGTLLLGRVSWLVERSYRKHLFGDATLQDLPNDPPRFVINATNVQTGVLWRFERPYMRDYTVGEVKSPRVALAKAVAASSAFPPVLSPSILKLRYQDFSPPEGEPNHRSPYTTRVVLSDGGVYDNLGLEAAWKRHRTILVSDAGMNMRPQPRPWRNWLCHAVRVAGIVDNQVRSLRKRQVVGSFVAKARDGAYWRIGTTIDEYHTPNALPCPRERTAELANIPTRLAAMPDETQERLINWGYAICDAAMRRWVEPAAAAPAGFPYKRGV